MSESIPQFLTIPEAAEILRVSPFTVRRYIESKKIPSVRLGKSILIPYQLLMDQLLGREGTE